MTALARTKLSDPAKLGWPPTLPLEVAMREIPINELFESYNLDKDDYQRLSQHEGFLAQVKHYHDELQKEGMGFKIKARLQSEALLEKSWNMINDATGLVPPNVKADLLKFTIRAAGLDGSKDQAANAGMVGTALQINIRLD